MIQAREDMVWVVDSDGQRAPFCDAQLVASIVGVDEVHRSEEMTTVAESIAAAIYQFARDQQADRCIPSEEVAEMVEALLEMLGYEQRALAYAIERRQAEVQLDELAARSGEGFELAFYRELDETLERARQRRLIRLRMRGLRACVLRLRGAQRWGSGCRQLAQEIIDHVWARAERMELRQSNVLQLAVVE